MAIGSNKAAFDRANRRFRAAFQNSFEAQGTRTLDLLTYRIPDASKEIEESFAAFDGVDVPEHKDALHYADVTWYSFDTSNNPHAKGYRFRRQDWEIDKEGHHDRLARTIGNHVRTAQRLAAVRYLVNGFTAALGTTYDGQFLFDTDHASGSGTWSNLQSGALSEPNFDAAYSKLLGIPTPEGDSLYERFDGEIDVKLVVGPENKSTADDLVKATIDGGEVNPRANRATVSVLSDLRAGGTFDAFKNFWFLMAMVPADPELSPLTLKENGNPELLILNDPRDEEAFERDMYRIKVRHDYGLGYRAPWTIVGSTGA